MPIYRPQDKKRTKVLAVKLTEEEHRAICKLAESKGMTAANFVRKALAEWARIKIRQREVGELPPIG